MKVMLDPFYPIVDSAGWVRRVLDHGAKLVQLRIKNESDEKLREQIRLAKNLCEAAGAQLVVNDYWKIALEEGCDFVHLGQEDFDDADIAALKKAGIRIGISTHAREELARALSHAPDYIALGPIYPTLLKQMEWAPQGLDRITEWKKEISALPLVAIGGITLERASLCLQAGADSVAVVTDIVRADNPGQRIHKWLETTREAA
ncbi:MAG: thiamine phosphate synthase [Pseudomonadota bacterium]